MHAVINDACKVNNTPTAPHTQSIQMATGRFFRQVHLPEQKHYDDGVIFPVVVSPNTNTYNLSAEAKVCAFKEAIKAEKQWLESLVDKCGVILFRGFPVTSPSDFNDIVEAFGFPEMVYVGGRAPRTQVVGRVYTANESPPEYRINFHHEMAYVREIVKFIYEEIDLYFKHAVQILCSVTCWTT